MKKEHKAAIANTVLLLYREHHLGGIEASTRQYFWQYYTRALRAGEEWSFDDFYERYIPEQVRQTRQEKAAYHEKMHKDLLEQCYEVLTDAVTSRDDIEDLEAVARLEQLEQLERGEDHRELSRHEGLSRPDGISRAPLAEFPTDLDD